MHNDDVIMGTMASQITSLTIVYSTVYSGADQSKHQSSASLAFVRGIHRGPVNSPHKWPVTRKMFPFDDVIQLKWRSVQVLINKSRFIYTYIYIFFKYFLLRYIMEPAKCEPVCFVINAREYPLLLVFENLNRFHRPWQLSIRRCCYSYGSIIKCA